MALLKALFQLKLQAVFIGRKLGNPQLQPRHGCAAHILGQSNLALDLLHVFTRLFQRLLGIAAHPQVGQQHHAQQAQNSYP